jgi:pimeloyl-ACP methyl ester carboxylesterase
MTAGTDSPTGIVDGTDGTPIAYWTTGAGPAVVLVHGTTSDHTTMNEIAPHFARTRSVTTFDRRGRGESGDADAYDFDLELDDAAAVFAEIAEQNGGPVDVFSHSFGSFVAVGAAARSPHVRSVVAYSAGFGVYPEGALERIDAAAASDDLDTALQVVFREVIGMTDPEIAGMRESPVWAVRVAAAGTVPRECRADESFLRDYADELAGLKVPVLVVSGETNTPAKRQIATDLAAAIPTAELYEMPGQGHVAHHFAPAELSELANRFFERAATPADATAG